jgi:hypothetical protein
MQDQHIYARNYAIDSLAETINTPTEVENLDKTDHKLVRAAIHPNNRQNYRSCEKILTDKVLTLLEIVSNVLYTRIYIQVCKRKNNKPN